MAILKLLRNQAYYATHEAAITGINTKGATLNDGEMWLATYGEGANAKTLLAVKRGDGANGSVTIFDNEGNAAAITSAINALDGTVGSTSVETGKHVAVQVVETDGIITSLTVTENDIASAALLGTTSDTASQSTAFGYIAKEAQDRGTAITNAINALDVTDTAVAKKFVTSVSETDGKITVSRGEVTSTDKTITLGDGSDGGIDVAVNIDGTTIVKETTSTANKGKLSVGTVPAEQVSVADTGNKFTGTNVETVLAEIDDKISSTSSSAKKYKVVAVDNPASTSLAEYKLQVAQGSSDTYADVTDSTTIVVPKDNAFVTAQLGHVGASVDATTGVITDGTGEDALLIEYISGSGVYTLVAVPIGSFLKESEFKNGLSVSNTGEVSAKLGQGLEFGGESGENQSIKVKIDANSEKDSQTTPADFLTVGSDGVKIQGIGSEIDRKIAASAISAQGDNYITAEVDSNNNKKINVTADVQTLTVAKSGTADTTITGTADSLVDGADVATKVSNFVNARLAEEVAEINAVIEENERVTSAALNDLENDKAEASDLTAEIAARKAVDGQNGETYTANSTTNYINAATSLNDADVKLDTALKNLADSAAVASDLTAEITARKAVDGQSGQTYVANSNANYINTATSLNDADVKLDGALKTVDDSMLTGITGSDAITVTTKASKNQTVSLKLDTTTGSNDNALTITSGQGLYLSKTIDCGTY